jgi:hypothetical protein
MCILSIDVFLPFGFRPTPPHPAKNDKEPSLANWQVHGQVKEPQRRERQINDTGTGTVAG